MFIPRSQSTCISKFLRSQNMLIPRSQGSGISKLLRSQNMLSPKKLEHAHRKKSLYKLLLFASYLLSDYKILYHYCLSIGLQVDVSFTHTKKWMDIECMECIECNKCKNVMNVTNVINVMNVTNVMECNKCNRI